jgi:hypothetical protein
MEAPMNELGPEARAIFDAAREGDHPTAADRARIRASVMRAIAAGSAVGAGGAAAAVKASGGLATGWKLTLLALAIGAAATLAAVGFDAAQAPGPPPAADRAAQPVIAAASASAPPAIPATPAAPEPSARAVAAEWPVTAPPPAGVVASAVAPRLARGQEPRRDATRADDAAITPRSEAPADSNAGAPPPAPPPVAAAPPPAAPPPAASPVVGPSVDADTLVAETRRLREAHAALQGGDGARALALLQEQSAVGPQLREERAAARILALCSLGRKDEARIAAARFLGESPRSPLADRVRASCAGR